MSSSPRHTKAVLLATAYHEAGHAIAAYWHRVGLRGVTIEPGKGDLGRTWHGNPMKNHPADTDASNADRSRMERLARGRSSARARTTKSGWRRASRG